MFVDGHSPGQGLLKIIEYAIQRSCELERVCTWLFLDAENNGRFGVVRALGSFKSFADLNNRDIADQDGTCLNCLDGRAPYIVFRSGTAHTLDQIFLSAGDHEPGR